LLDINSLLKLNYGMYIVSSAKDGKFNGCIVNSLFQIVPEPPMIATSINKECLTHEYISNSNILTASVLSIKADMAFIRGFGFRSGRDINKFENINYKLGQEDAPIIVDNTVAFVEARVLHSYDIETHTLFIAKVTACETTNPSEEPMTYTHYRDIKHGRTPKAAATYYKPESHKQLKEGANKMKNTNVLSVVTFMTPKPEILKTILSPELLLKIYRMTGCVLSVAQAKKILNR